MIVGFREFEGQFSSRLEFCVGAVLVSPDGVQYECVKRSNYGAQWKIVGGQGDDGCVSIVRMRELVGDGAGWLWAISRVEGKVREWLVLRVCGALALTAL